MSTSERIKSLILDALTILTNENGLSTEFDQLQLDYLVYAVETFLNGGADPDQRSALMETIVSIIQGADYQIRPELVRVTINNTLLNVLAPQSERTEEKLKISVNLAERA